VATVAALLLALAAPTLRAEEPDPKEVKAVLDKAIASLKKAQKADGSWGLRAQSGVTGLVVTGMLRNGVAADDPAVVKALAYLESKVQKDGGIFDAEKEKGLANYVTSVCLMTFAQANKDGKYATLLKNGVEYLKTLQHAGDEGELAFGGAGYGPGSRPDMSNTQFFIDALIAAGVPKNDPAIVKAMKFVSRSQNLPGETNDQPFAKKATEDDKGGLVYDPGAANKAPDGLRSAGAMTYGGLKSFLYAGVAKDDPRVKGAVAWIRGHYTLDENPGQGQSGLYYYYHTLGKAMEAFGEEPFVDAKGGKHEWRKDLFEALKKRQKDDGSWVNDKDRTYGESDPSLASAFGLLSLSYCKKK
jgi:squalene-hopene/tetraprenyl-beta-curcumene cyclase